MTSAPFLFILYSLERLVPYNYIYIPTQDFHSYFNR